MNTVLCKYRAGSLWLHFKVKLHEGPGNVSYMYPWPRPDDEGLPNALANELLTIPGVCSVGLGAFCMQVSHGECWTKEEMTDAIVAKLQELYFISDEVEIQYENLDDSRKQADQMLEEVLREHLRDILPRLVREIPE